MKSVVPIAMALRFSVILMLSDYALAIKEVIEFFIPVLTSAVV
jgi:hypothetical protein